MRTRILFVIDNLQFGGGERVFSQIINGLNQDNYKIFICSSPGSNFYESISNKDVHFLPLDFSKRFSPLLLFKLRKLIKKNKISIVHGQGTRAEFYARLANCFAGTSKYISTIAMPVEGFDVAPFRKKIYHFFDRLSERYVDRFIVVSDSLKNQLVQEHGINPDKISRIYNGIEIDQYSPENLDADRKRIREEFDTDENTHLVGAIGRLAWQKGFDYLINAVPGILKYHPNTKFLIAGEGPLEKRLRAQGARLRVSKSLIFTGFRNDIKEILSAIDILVIPSLQEGFPMITLEGMAMEKPIIGTEISGIKEQIEDNESGLLVRPGDTDALAEIIIRLLDTPDYARELGLNGRKRVKNDFSIQKMLAETEKIYNGF